MPRVAVYGSTRFGESWVDVDSINIDGFTRRREVLEDQVVLEIVGPRRVVLVVAPNRDPLRMDGTLSRETRDHRCGRRHPVSWRPFNLKLDELPL